MKQLRYVLLLVALVVPVTASPGVAATDTPAPARPTASPTGGAPWSATTKEEKLAYYERRLIGHSVKGRKIWAWRLGTGKSKKKVLLLASMHGNETAAARTLRALRDGPVVSGADIWVVPTVNPDGVAKGTRQNAHGVDLNRNFSTGWQKQGGATSSGSKAFSEPETRAIRDFADRIDATYTISFHQPLNGIDIRDTGNDKWAQRLAKDIGLPKKAFDCFSSCHGTYSMWFRKNHRKGAVITVEMTKSPSRTYLEKTAVKAVLSSVGATR